MENNQPKISVIVPIYNAEKYLHRCIDSILNQTFTDFEVLLINDGSTDQSPAICDEYAKKDSRVRVFHKENGGVSSARNIGLQNMIGEYSIHCDSDDWIEKDMLECLYSYTEKNNLDFIICDFYEYDKKNDVKLRIQRPSSLLQEQIIIDLLMGKLHGSTWNKLVKTTLIKQHNVLFNENIRHSEDTLFNVNILLKNKNIKIGYLQKSFYNYRYNVTSITKTIDDKLAFSFIEYISELDKILPMNNCDINRAYMAHCVIVKSYFLHSGVFTLSFIRNYKRESNSYLFFTHLRYPMKTLLLCIFKGVYPFAHLLNYLLKIKNKFVK